MSNFSIGGVVYRYLRNDNLCTVVADYPDRHMVRIRMENGLELDEVNYHDVGPVEPAAPPAAEPAAEPAPSEDAPPADAVEEQPRQRATRHRHWGAPDAN